MNKKSHIDPYIFVIVLALMLFSVAVVFSASAAIAEMHSGNSASMMGKHALKIFIGFGAMIFAINFDYNNYKKLTGYFLVASVGLLLMTLIVGSFIKGATRWLSIGGISFQPSEFAKVALLFHVCAFLARVKSGIRDLREGYLKILTWIGFVTVCVLLQPNFSTSIMILTITFTVLFVGRARLTHLAVTVGSGFAVVAAYMLTKPNQLARVSAFLSGNHISSDVNYQLYQGIIGFALGGVFGVGPGESKQREFFLPESYGDFIYSIIGEEYGLIGTLLILTLFLIIMFRGFKIARYAPNDFGKYLAIGITSMISFYTLINAGVTLGIFPTTGLPMPFISYGGSNLLFSCFSIGVLLNISSQTDLIPREATVNDSIQPLSPPEPARGRVYIVEN
jgi:cell division protein FtsW